MARFIKTCLMCSLIFGWAVLAAQEPQKLVNETIRISDLGLASEVPSAIDLVGPGGSSAERHRDALVQRMQCWIEGDTGCSTADVNDPRVRAIRRFIALGPADRDGQVTVHFPDETRVELRLERVSNPDPDDWNQPVYRPVVVPDTAQVPGLADVPSGPDHLQSLAYEGPPAIQAALERLRQRF